jgi:hypothetical protein
MINNHIGLIFNESTKTGKKVLFSGVRRILLILYLSRLYYTVIDVCRVEQRRLVTLDLDFSNPLQYNPANYSGIAVLRLPKRPSRQDLLDVIVILINALKTETIVGKLWIIKQGQIRIYQPE